MIKDQETKHYEMRKRGGIVQGYVQQLVNMLAGQIMADWDGPW